MSQKVADRLRLAAIHDMACIACVKEAKRDPKRMFPYSQPLPTEAHHLVDKGDRAKSGGHQATVPLCSWHHRGEPKFDMRPSEMRFEYGPSLELDKPAFVKRYGTERELLAEINEKVVAA